MTFVPIPPAGVSTPTTARAQAGSGFVRLVWLALALSVVAVIEPSPGDIGVALLLAQGFLCGHLSWRNTPALPLALLGFYVLANLTSLCYAVDPVYGVTYGLITLFMLTLWIFTVGVLTRFGERGLRVLMSGYTAGGVVSAALALLSYLGLIPFGDVLLFYGQRLKGFFKDPNVFAPYLVIVAAYALCRLQLRQGSFARKAAWVFVCLVSSLGVLLSFSRAAWANYVVTLGVLFVLNSMAARAGCARRRNVVYFLIAGVVVAAAVAYTLSTPQVSEFVAYRSEMQSYDEERFAAHEAALQLGLDSPLGVGPGQSHLLIGFNPHSLILGVFSENGIVGLLSLMGFVLLTLIRSLWLSQRCAHRFQRLMFALVAAAIAGTLLNSIVIDPIHWRHFWFLLALGWMPLWAGEDTHKHGPSTAKNISPATAGPRPAGW